MLQCTVSRKKSVHLSSVHMQFLLLQYDFSKVGQKSINAGPVDAGGGAGPVSFFFF